MTGERTLPGAGLTGYWDLGDSTWKPGMDANLRAVSALLQLSVKTRTTALPGSPAQGDMHLVPGDAGVSPNQIALYDSGAWVYIAPRLGTRAFVDEDDKFYWWNGAAWVLESGGAETGGIYDVPLYLPDKPSNAMIAARIAVVRAFSLPAGFTGSVASAGTASTGTATFDVQKGTTSIGSVTFTASATGIFASAAGASFAAGDVLRVIAPGTADATLSDISISFMGARV